MCTDALGYASNCPQCAIVQETSEAIVSPHCDRTTIEVDTMELPITTRRNRYVIVLQDLFTK